MNRRTGISRATGAALLVLTPALASGCGGPAGHAPAAPSPHPSASATQVRYPVTPTRPSDAGQADQFVEQLKSFAGSPHVTLPESTTDLMVLRPLTDADGDAAWLPDSGSACLLSSQSGGTPAPHVGVSCLDLPARSPADPPVMVGPSNLGGNDHAMEWFAAVIGSTNPVVVRHDPDGEIDPLNQATAKAANGVTYTVVEYHALDYPNGTPSPPLPADAGTPQLCIGSGALCRDALQNG
ncbi:hypothetical protein ABH930_003650 [Kitasatospora sp. GAS204A]|uniref:hypothetical protein n=1 Tax=unclassified Kitasatospora TaxID=2633591 RepID=UPI0024738284|nr:hypothetical protein [Kitasatospora sp. GAS204B]MDH6118705.1 hypothetical protein [Kitasatospora sp. GAS204B]